jgi:hypothetical protein
LPMPKNAPRKLISLVLRVKFRYQVFIKVCCFVEYTALGAI